MSGLNSAGGALRQIQQMFLESLVSPGSTGAKALNATFLPGAQLDAAACLGIYQRSYRLRLRKCLGDQFPASRHALGENLFADFADEYLRACPSDSYTLYELGRRFPDWLEASRPDRDQPLDKREHWIDFMVDLAGYERVLFHLFDASGHEGHDWPKPDCSDALLVLQPCLRLVHYRYPVAAYYHAVRAGEEPSFPVAAESYNVVLRRDYQTATYPVSALHFRFLQMVQECGSVDAALCGISEWSGRPLAVVTASWHEEVKRAWIDAGFFVYRA